MAVCLYSRAMTEPKVDIAALANLVRLEVSDAELAKLEKEIPEILRFVDAIQKAAATEDAPAPKLRNVMRPDADAYEAGTYSERLLAAAPSRKGDRIAVKQVISRRKK